MFQKKLAKDGVIDPDAMMQRSLEVLVASVNVRAILKQERDQLDIFKVGGHV